MREGAFDEAKIEPSHDSLGGPQNGMRSVNPPPQPPEPLGQWITKKLNRIEFWGAGWKWEKQYSQWLSIQTGTIPQIFTQIFIVPGLVDGCIIAYNNIICLQPSTSYCFFQKESKRETIMIIFA